MSERRIVSDTGPLITLEKLPNGYQFIRTINNFYQSSNA